MPISSIFTVIAVLIIVSMIFSGISYNRQQTMKRLKAQINRYKQQADELIGPISLLLKIDNEYELICQLQQFVVGALQAAHNLAPDDPLIISNFQSQSSRLQYFKSGNRENKVKCYTTNDGELSLALGLITQLSKILDIYRNRGILSVAKFQELSLHLQTVKVDLDINSNLYQADSFAEENNITMYQMHLKQALEVLKRSVIENKDKNIRIKQLSDKLNEVKKTNKVLGDQSLFKTSENHPDSKSAKPVELSAEKAKF